MLAADQLTSATIVALSMTELISVVIAAGGVGG